MKLFPGHIIIILQQILDTRMWYELIMITDTYAIQALSGKPIRVKKYGKPGDAQKEN